MKERSEQNRSIVREKHKRAVFLIRYKIKRTETSAVTEDVS